MSKNQISELEKELSEKNAVIDFLTSQFITKPLDTSTNKNISHNNNHQIIHGNNEYNHHDNKYNHHDNKYNHHDNKYYHHDNKYNHHDTPMEKSINDKARKEVIIISDSVFFGFFSVWVFFREHSRITVLQGKGEGISLTPHYHFYPLHRHLDVSRVITAESSPLHIASSQTETRNLWFPSASR